MTRRRKKTSASPRPFWSGRLAAFAGIAAVVCLAFWPSLFHIARADHWSFLVTSAPYDSCGAVVRDLYSFTRVRFFDAGDCVLFRPLLFAVMAMESHLFGWNFFWWQATGILLHLAAAYALLRLLWAMHRGLFAALLTLFFATLFIAQMAVTWQHINGYVLFVVLELWALYQVFQHAEEGQIHPWRLWAIAAIVLAGGLTYEAANVQGPFFALYLLCVGHAGDRANSRPGRRRLLLLLVPLLVYVTWDIVDFRFLHPTCPDIRAAGSGDIVREFGVMKTAGTLCVIPACYLFAALFPTLQQMTGGKTLISRPVNWDLAGSFSTMHPLWAILVAGTTVVCILIVGYALATRLTAAARVAGNKPTGPRWCFAALVASLMMVQLMLVAIGRANTRGLVDYVLKESSYYAYLVVALMVVIAYACCRSIGFDTLARAVGPRRRLLCAAVLTGVSLAGACRIYVFNATVMRQYPASKGIMVARVDMQNLDKYYQCRNDAEYGNVLLMYGYLQLKCGVRCAVTYGQREQDIAKVAIARRIMPFDSNFYHAVELDEQGKPEQALAMLDSLKSTTNTINGYLPFFTWEYGKACAACLDASLAGIAREPGNPQWYRSRADLYCRFNEYGRALAEIEKFMKYGGSVEPKALEELRRMALSNAPPSAAHR